MKFSIDFMHVNVWFNVIYMTVEKIIEAKMFKKKEKYK